jgi:WD40 repeat protein
MGAILVQQSPLCILDLKGLLELRNPGSGEPADIEHFVRRLRTVLVAGAGEINGRTVPCVHRSFSDFVTSAGAGGFRVDTISADGELAIRCIHQLDRLWKLREQSKLEMLVQYAVSHWSSHLARVVGVKVEEADSDSISIPDAENIVLDPKMNTGAPVATEKTSHTEDTLYCITVSQDGTRIVSAQGQSIRLRDTQTGDDIVPPMLGHGDVYFVAFSPDEQHIVSASNNTICVWNSETGDMALGPMKGHTSVVYSAVVSPDGRCIVSASVDKTICIWNSDTGDMVLGPLQGHTSAVWGAVFSPDGRLIVSASHDKTICIWNSDTGNMVLGPLEGHTNAVEFAVFSADGQHIVSCSNDGTIIVWDSQTGERVPASSEGEPDAKLSFTNSETAPYIVTPPQGNIPLQGISTSSYYFHLEHDDVAVGGVVNSGIDTWLYANSGLGFVMGRYLGQLILKYT